MSTEMRKQVKNYPSHTAGRKKLVLFFKYYQDNFINHYKCSPSKMPCKMFNLNISIDCNLVVYFLSDNCDQQALYVKLFGMVLILICKKGLILRYDFYYQARENINRKTGNMNLD